MKELFARWGSEVHFLDVLIRQAHPGPDAPPYATFEEKLEDARRYQREEALPWVLLVDDLEGTVHQAYGGLADPTYLIGTDGRVSYYNMWTYVPSLHQALDALIRQGGHGVVLEGVNQRPHMLPALTTGWRGLQRGLPQSYIDMELASPGAGTATFLGYQLRPLLGPFTQRSRPLPTAVKVGLAVGAFALAALAARRLARR
jgi:hypothetical protein